MKVGGMQTTSSSQFKSEKDLVKAFEQDMTEEMRRTSPVWGISREVMAGRSVADLIAWWLQPNQSLLPVLPLTLKESVMLSVLRRRKSTRIDVLERLCGLEAGNLRNGAFLERLEEWTLVVRGPGGKIGLSTHWPPDVTIVAFEAKLRDTCAALEQASRYRRYADKSYVVLPSSRRLRLEEQRSVFKEAGVGAFLVGHGGTEKALEAASVDSYRHDWQREFILSRLFAATCIR